jgi:diguanylate cyclase (GGDEF)-like protein
MLYKIYYLRDGIVMLRVVFILLLFIAPLLAKVVLTDELAHYDNFTMQYLDDKTGEKTIEEIANTPFSHTTSNEFTFGYKADVIWFKIELENLSNINQYVLSFNEVLWKNFDFYYQRDGKWLKKVNGLDVPLFEREIKDVNPAFNFSLEKNRQTTLYVRAKTISGQLGKFEIFSHDEYFNPTRITITKIYISVAFMLIGIIFLNIYSLYLTRELTYVYYVAYVFTSIAFTSMHSGSYLIVGMSGWNEGLHTVGAFLVLFLVLFTDRFLEFKKELPTIHKLLMSAVGILLICIIFIFYNASKVPMIFNIYSIFVFIVLFIGVIKTLIKGVIDVKLYLFALIVYMFFMGLMIGTFNSLLPYMEVTRHLFLLGGFIEIILFTFILTRKYRIMTLEKLRIQAELLQEKGKNEAYLESEIDKRTEELQLLASTDSMTKLYNRRYFTETSSSIFDLAKRNQTALTVIMIDIDDFKSINDTHGHAVGDKVIVGIAQILQNCSRKSDVVSRWGGEEFLMLLPQTDMNGALVIAEKVRDMIEKKEIQLESKQKIHFTVSLGVSLVNVHNELNLEASIGRADKALYKAKENGKNRVISSLM